MSPNKTLLFVLFIKLLSLSYGYRILAIFPFHGRSHMGVLEQSAKALAEQGHQVDVISHFPLKEKFPNYTDIIALPKTGTYATMDFKTLISVEDRTDWLYDEIRNMCDYLGTSEVQELIQNQRKNVTYDLLLVHYISGYQCFSAIGYVLNLPVVGVVTTHLYSWMNTFVGNPLNLAISPNTLYGFEKDEMDFWDRLNNVVQTYRSIRLYYSQADEQNYFIKKYLGSDMPDYHVLERRTALIMSNSHYSYNGIMPKTPAVIQIGGIHIKNDTTKLDKNLMKIMDSSKDGFIYFSFGSMTLIETFTTEAIEKFYTTFRNLSPLRVIMRASQPELMPKNLPENVFVYSWLPQQQILQHPNIKAFVTHGGGLGTQEAIYYAVPMICIPLFAEQIYNCDTLMKKNLALKLNFATAQQENYEYVFQEIISNPVYKKMALKLSAVYRDRPLTPSEEVIYWIEYVIRHGSNTLRSPAVNLQWWQAELLDVYFFIFTCIVLALGVGIFIVYKILTLLRCRLSRKYTLLRCKLSKVSLAKHSNGTAASFNGKLNGTKLKLTSKKVD